MNKPELLAPAGSLEKGRMALLYGADAVYLGGKAFGLRAFAANFSLEEIREMAAFAHEMGKKVYVTVNIFPHNSDLPPLPEYLRNLDAAGVDALLVSDLGVWNTAREVAPRLDLHVSTQANVTNWATARAWEQLGASRVCWPGNCPLRKSGRSGKKSVRKWKCSSTGPCAFPIPAGAF